MNKYKNELFYFTQKSSSKEKVNYNPDKLLNVYVFNKLFSCMLEVFGNKRSKYELVLSDVCSVIA